MLTKAYQLTNIYEYYQIKDKLPWKPVYMQKYMIYIILMNLERFAKMLSSYSFNLFQFEIIDIFLVYYLIMENPWGLPRALYMK